MWLTDIGNCWKEAETVQYRTPVCVRSVYMTTTSLGGGKPDIVSRVSKEMECSKWIIANAFQNEMDRVGFPSDLSRWLQEIMSK